MTERRLWTTIRLILGLIQMTAAAVALGLLAGGVTPLALIVVVLTCLLTTISVVLFGRRPADTTAADATPAPRA